MWMRHYICKNVVKKEEKVKAITNEEDTFHMEKKETAEN